MGFPKKRKAAARAVFRQGAKPAGISADDALDELNRIRRDAGELTAKAVVNESRPEEAVLHGQFEWRDDVAGERYREHQATSLIRSIRVIEPEADETTPAFINVQPSGHVGKYEPPIIVAASVDFLAPAASNAQRQLNSAQKAVEDLHAIVAQDGDDRAALILAAIKSIEVARDAVSKFH